MSSDFNSFDESPMGGFIESPLGARGYGDGIIAVIVCNGAYPPASGQMASWLQDTTDLQERIANGQVVGAAVGHPPGFNPTTQQFSYTPIVPSGQTSPVPILRDRLSTFEAAFAVYQAAINSLYPNASGRLVFCMDTSSSMQFSSINGILALQAHLNAEGVSFDVHEFEDTPERWASWPGIVIDQEQT